VVKLVKVFEVGRIARTRKPATAPQPGRRNRLAKLLGAYVFVPSSLGDAYINMHRVVTLDI
jgi:hypothetical protein